MDRSIINYILFVFAGASATAFASFGQGVGPIHLDNVFCDGSEGTLFNCTHILTDHNCVHAEDAGAVCSKYNNLQFHHFHLHAIIIFLFLHHFYSLTSLESGKSNVINLLYHCLRISLLRTM